MVILSCIHTHTTEEKAWRLETPSSLLITQAGSSRLWGVMPIENPKVTLTHNSSRILDMDRLPERESRLLCYPGSDLPVFSIFIYSTFAWQNDAVINIYSSSLFS